jgi:hypothetical protein
MGVLARGQALTASTCQLQSFQHKDAYIVDNLDDVEVDAGIISCA